MGLQWTARIVKHFLFLFNLLFVITGIVILTAGASIKAKYFKYVTFLDDNYFSVPNLLIAIGAIIFIIAFFGCCGAIKENFCMTITFSTLLILIFILELAAGISGYILRNSTAEFMEEKLTASLNKYNSTDADELTKTWDIIQQTFNCCGVNGPADWTKQASTKNMIPISCCKPSFGLVGQLNCTEDVAFRTGCEEAFGAYISDHAYVLGGIGMGFAMIQLLGIIFSCHLSKQLKYYDNF